MVDVEVVETIVVGTEVVEVVPAMVGSKAPIEGGLGRVAPVMSKRGA